MVRHDVRPLIYARWRIMCKMALIPPICYIRAMTHKTIMTPDQCRAARALLGWKRSDLAEKSEVSERSLVSFEGGKAKLLRANHRAVAVAFEAAGLEFIPGGVRSARAPDADPEPATVEPEPVPVTTAPPEPPLLSDETAQTIEAIRLDWGLASWTETVRQLVQSGIASYRSPPSIGQIVPGDLAQAVVDFAADEETDETDALSHLLNFALDALEHDAEYPEARVVSMTEATADRLAKFAEGKGISEVTAIRNLVIAALNGLDRNAAAKLRGG